MPSGCSSLKSSSRFRLACGLMGLSKQQIGGGPKFQWFKLYMLYEVVCNRPFCGHPGITLRSTERSSAVNGSKLEPPNWWVILKYPQACQEVVWISSDMLWQALTYFTIAFQCISNETSQRPLQACVAVCHFGVCRYPMFKQTLIPQIPIIDTTTSSYTTTPGFANGLIPTQSTTMVSMN